MLLLASVLLIGACLTYTGLAGRKANSEATATAQVDASLTAQYGNEVRIAIETFEQNWQSLEAHTNPSIQSELATGSYLDYWGYARMGPKVYDEPFWLITRSATVTYLRVIEYGPQRFRAVANVEEDTNEVTPQGEFVKTLPKLEWCILYLFAKESGAWKVADLFNMTIERDIDRDWENLVAWEKQFVGQQMMGDLPQEKCPHMK